MNVSGSSAAAEQVGVDLSGLVSAGQTHPAKQELPGVSLWHCLWLQGKQEKCTGSHWYLSQLSTWCLAVGPYHGAA